MPIRTRRFYFSDAIEKMKWIAEIEVDEAHPVPITVGSAVDNDLPLPRPSVAPLAVTFHPGVEGWSVVAEDVGCYLSGRRLPRGKRVPVVPREELRIASYTLFIGEPHEDSVSPEVARAGLDLQACELVATIHRELLTRIPKDTPLDDPRRREEIVLRLEHDIDEIGRGLLAAGPSGLTDHIAGQCVRSELLRTLIDLSGANARAAQCPWSEMVSVVEALERDLKRLLAHANKALRFNENGPLEARLERLDAEFWAYWAGHSGVMVDHGLSEYLALRMIKKDLKDSVFGFGPLEDLLRTPTVGEIMVNGSQTIFIEHEKKLKRSGRRFVSDDNARDVIVRMVGGVNRHIDLSRPIVDARLSDGSRINAILPPLAIDGPCLTVRKFPDRAIDMPSLVASGSITASAARFIEASVIDRRNIIVSGGTGSGKTTFLNCLGGFIPKNERIITIEDTAELRLQHPHVVRAETRDRNGEGQGAIAVRDLVKNALRMRPDRIVVGECRGAEALDMLQAMNTGHDGSLTTIHANSPIDVVSRLEVMLLSAAELPLAAIHRQIASGIDLIVHLQRFGKRHRVTRITELTGYDRKAAMIRTRDLYRDDSETGPLRPTGCLPTFIGALVSKGLRLDTFFE